VTTGDGEMAGTVTLVGIV